MDAVALATAPDPAPSLDELFGLDVAGLADGELVEAMMAARRLAARAQAVQVAAVAELARRRYAEDEAAESRGVVRVISPRDYVHDEVAEALTLTAYSADQLIRFATELTDQFPATFAALSAGNIDYAKAHTIWHSLDPIDDDELTADIEDRVLSRAPEQTTGEIRAKIRRLIRRLAPEALERRRREAETLRALTLTETNEGTAYLTGADLPTHAADAAYRRITAIATGLKSDGDDRGIDQLRADVYLAILRGTLTPTTAPADPTTADRPTADPTTADRPTADPTAADNPAWTAVDDDVADIIAHTARTQLHTLTDDLPERHRNLGPLLTHATQRITATLTGLRQPWCLPTEHDYDGRDTTPGHGHPGYRPPAALRRLIQHRDRRCCFPGCRRPTRHCDADHTIPYHRGGPTCTCNMAMLCRHHHRLKVTHGWHIEHLWPGVICWITPAGHWRITAPADRE